MTTYPKLRLSPLQAALIINEFAATIEEADLIIRGMNSRVIEGEEPEYILSDYGLIESDFVYEILW